LRPEESSISFTRAPPRTFLAAVSASVGARFFDEAEAWPEVPAEMDSPTMEQAMEILHDSRKDTFLNDLYRGRAEAERVERGAQKALERAPVLGPRHGNEECPHRAEAPRFQVAPAPRPRCWPNMGRCCAAVAPRRPPSPPVGAASSALRGGSTQVSSTRPSASA
jgi:hypothetical protein